MYYTNVVLNETFLKYKPLWWQEKKSRCQFHSYYTWTKKADIKWKTQMKIH